MSHFDKLSVTSVLSCPPEFNVYCKIENEILYSIHIEMR